MDGKQTNRKKDRRGERGAIIVEATISLTVFMFAMFTLLSLTQIAYTQARMSLALTSATKEIAQYVHVYYVTEMDTALPSSGGKSSELFGKVAELLGTVGGEVGTIDGELGRFVTDTGNAISGDSLGDMLTHFVGGGIVEQMMMKNLATGSSSSGEEFLANNRVSNLDFGQSKFLEGGKKDIFMHVSYDIKVIELLDIDYTFHMSTWAYATAWGD